mmetsp:Transcript_1544/g.3582  ORF Transcript_1544/g.3582 Transcript_1544/m.3582 type:complete len:441 (-) Transcript_1544:302-1624(-)|eukprot:CAMPEP_0116101584 /NCGR_PEP_ID=MMETSP0327-20121206/12890_1 /TAXON_ID=44447 /ORGANISM="Pseudo-nitzschia delicatissima, Strain B596" /LENGTH=440 /DNA_ID=CAMNT_0003593559 /DNA_START=102 /DNA_END=1424 /DNA_ORIENTATION=+
MRFLPSCSPFLIAIYGLLFQERRISTVALGENLSKTNLTPERNPNGKSFDFSNALEEALNLEPPAATSVEGGDTEGSEWWLEHEGLLRSAWKQWDERRNNGSKIYNKEGFTVLPSLDANLIDPDLRYAMDRTRHSPTLEHETKVHQSWIEILSSTVNKDLSSQSLKSCEKRDSEIPNPHRVYQYKDFLTTDGIQKLRSHLDTLSNNGIPKRRPNAMNRNGLLLDPSVPGGVSGDLELQRFVELLASDYLRPLGRSLFPEFAGDTGDDVKHYAFTIRYGADENNRETNAAKDALNTTTDWDLKEHSDASVYTLNINLNLSEEDYSGSSLYFVTQEGRNNTKCPSEVRFEPGTALLHRGMTKHGARPLEGGKRNNLIIWLHGIDGYVRIAPYEEKERLSVEERWSSQSGGGGEGEESSTTLPFQEIGLKSDVFGTKTDAIEL